MKIQKAIDERLESLYKEKQQIPWTGTNVGPAYAVTTGAVSYEIDKLQKSIRDILRDVRL